MKSLSLVISVLALLPPLAVKTELMVTLRARVVPRCEIISVEAASGKTEIVVRTVCNRERFELMLLEPINSLIASASAENAVVSVGRGTNISVSVQRPGIQRVRISLGAPIGLQAPGVVLKTV